jgi:hypothetical protein
MIVQLLVTAVQFIPMVLSEDAIFVAGNSTWTEKDDPVMGGGSKGTVALKYGWYSTWQGSVKNVSFLHAPGFCSIDTTSIAVKDAHAYIKGGLVLKVRSSTPEYTGFKLKFYSPSIPVHHGSHGHGLGSQAQPFKVPASKMGEWHDVFLPFHGFSYDWSDFTGDCFTKDPDGFQHRCCNTTNHDVCPTAKQLESTQRVSIYAEGVEGDFQLDIEEIMVTAVEAQDLETRTGCACDKCASDRCEYWCRLHECGQNNVTLV